MTLNFHFLTPSRLHTKVSVSKLNRFLEDKRPENRIKIKKCFSLKCSVCKSRTAFATKRGASQDLKE